MITMKKLPWEQVEKLNEEGATDFLMIWQSEDGKTSLSLDKHDKWLFFHQDRVFEFDKFEDAVQFAEANGIGTEKRISKRQPTPYERTRNAVYATGNKWQIEKFNATHN